MRLIVPLIVLAASIAARIALDIWGGIIVDATAATALDVSRFGKTLIWLGAGFVVVRLVDAVLWDGWLRGGKPAKDVPRLLRTVTSVLLWLLILIGIVSVVFGQSVTGLLTASSVVVAVIGFAARNLIGDLFFGIALATERPFKVGDWIRLEDGTEGEVIEMNWRATHILTRGRMDVVIPNGMMASSRFENFYRPEHYFRERFTARLDYAVTGYQVERLMLSAVRQELLSMNLPQEPEVRVKELLPDGVVWELRFWVPDRPRRTEIKSRIQRNFMRNLHYAGIEVARERGELIIDTVDRINARQPAGAKNWLSRIDLFGVLDPKDLSDLQDKADALLCRAGEPIVREGEEGSSLYVLVEGALRVSVTGADGEETTLSHLDPGRFFGELSLLTGEKRGATVTPVIDSRVYRITKGDLAPILARRPELAGVMSTFLAERHLANQRTLEELSAAEAETERDTLAVQFVQKITRFFDTGFLKTLRGSQRETLTALKDEALLEATMAAAAIVSMADGRVVTEERLEVKDVFSEVGMFELVDRTRGMSLFEKYCTMIREKNPARRQEMNASIKAIAPRQSDATLIIRLCCAVGEADGIVVEPEKSAIRDICHLLSVPPSEAGL